MAHFEPVTADTVKKLVANSKNATSNLDPLPTNLTKLQIDRPVPLITKISNLSLSTDIFPVGWKNTIVKPMLLKRLGMELIKNN